MADLQNGNELIKVDVFKKIGLEEGMHVGDLGCGNLAYYALTSAKLVGKSGQVYAIDILKSALSVVDARIAQENLKNIRTVWSNLELVGATNVPPASLDVAFIHNVLFQAGEHDNFLEETARLLKPGGKVMIIDWKKISSPFGPPVKDRPEPQLIKDMSTKAGLKLMEEFEAGPYHFGLIFTR